MLATQIWQSTISLGNARILDFSCCAALKLFFSGKVCAVDDNRPSASAVEFNSVADMYAAGQSYRVVNCGFCGGCSSDNAVEQYHHLGKGMTKDASQCAVVRFGVGAQF